jgi:hypothetical protein
MSSFIAFAAAPVMMSHLMQADIVATARPQALIFF